MPFPLTAAAGFPILRLYMSPIFVGFLESVLKSGYNTFNCAGNVEAGYGSRYAAAASIEIQAESLR